MTQKSHPIVSGGRPAGGPLDVEDVKASGERQPVEARLVQAERLATLGQLAAGVAHEINNPLSYVLASLDLLERTLAEQPALLGSYPDGMLQSLANAREGAERVRVIVKSLMAFSRPSASSAAQSDVESVLDSTVNLAWNEIRHRARLVKRYAGVPRVQADESRLGQVFLNLLLNAAQSIEDGRAVDAEIGLATRLEHDRVVVEVSDTGVGIPESDRVRVFDPFFTTKPPGEGTGLGLTICQSIVLSCGGDIGVESRVGEGSTFRVFLPVATRAQAPEEASRERAPERRPSRRARILIIDDEPLLGQTLTLAFCDHHDVVVAGSGRDALARLAEDDRFDLVLCDLMMPDVSGQKVFEAVELHHAALVPRFVFITGGAFTDRAREFLDRYAGARLEKPFTIADVDRLLRERI